jgi:ketosteroid isomerase-like protein
MRRAALIMLTCFAPTILASDGPHDASAEREIRELEAQFSRAVIKGDRAFYERVLADDFTHTSHTGVFKTRAEWMAEDKSAEKGDSQVGRTRYDTYDVDDLAIRIYGDMAVATGRTSPKGRNAQGQPISGQYRYLRVWVKREGRWQVVAFQGTRIAQPQG